MYNFNKKKEDICNKAINRYEYALYIQNVHLLVIRFIAPDVSSRIDEPSKVERNGVAKDGSHVPRCPRVFVP